MSQFIAAMKIEFILKLMLNNNIMFNNVIISNLMKWKIFKKLESKKNVIRLENILILVNHYH